MGLFKIPNIQNGVKKYQSGEPIETTLYSDQSEIEFKQVNGFSRLIRIKARALE